MFEADLINYLEADGTLDTLLGSSGTDSKIYPIQKPHTVTHPCILLSVSNSGSREENLREISFTFDSVATTYLEAKNISDKIVALLDLQDAINGTNTTTNFIIYWAKHTAGNTFVDSDESLFHNVVTIEFKYATLP